MVPKFESGNLAALAKRARLALSLLFLILLVLDTNKNNAGAVDAYSKPDENAPAGPSGEIEVIDSMAPANDLELPFGNVSVNSVRTETITIRNTHASQSLLIDKLQLTVVPQVIQQAATVAPADEGISRKGKTEFPIKQPHHPDQILVRFGRSTKPSARLSLHGQWGASRLNALELIPVDLVQLPKGSDLEAWIKKYESRAEVIYAEPNYIWTATELSDDPMTDQLWGLENAGQNGGLPGADIGVQEAWEISKGSQEVVVAVIDSGIDYTHPDLNANMWKNEAEATGSPGADDDHNGIVDDIYGARWTDIYGYPTSGNPLDGNGHGTHVAGTIGAVGNNSTGIVGVNWTVKLMALKFLDDTGSGSTVDAIKALEYAIAKKAHVTNNSWGGSQSSQALLDMINAAGDANQIFVTAAGNDNDSNDKWNHYPSNYPCENLIAVAASDYQDHMALFSNFSPNKVHIAAPGVSILSTWPGGEYYTARGTSMASPHVAGVAALVYSLDPQASFREVKRCVLEGAEYLPEWKNLTITSSRVDAAGALKQMLSPFRILDPPQTPTTILPGQTLTLEISFSSVSKKEDLKADLFIYSSDADEGVTKVALSGNSVEDGLAIEQPEGYRPSGDPTGPFSPPSKSYTLTNASADNLRWTAALDQDWVALWPSAGTLAAGKSTNCVLSLTPQAGRLTQGTYRATATFTNVETGAKLTREIHLLINTPLGEAVDDSSLTWTTGGNGKWFGQNKTSHDGQDAACSIPMFHYDLAWLETTVTGPGTLGFWWKVSSEADYDYLTFTIDGVEEGKISGNVDWSEKTYEIAAGSHQLRWQYKKDPATNRGSDCGWVDEVRLVKNSTLTVTPTGGLTASGMQGGPFGQSITYTVTNNGANHVPWSASSTKGWITKSKSSGTLAPGASTDVKISINNNANTKLPNTLTDVVTFKDLQSNAIQTRPVTLRIDPLPQPPEIPGNPTPAHKAVQVKFDDSLRWHSGINPTFGNGSTTKRPSDARLIDFSDFYLAPLISNDTRCLTTRYASEGVIFSGPTDLSGGAVLRDKKLSFDPRNIFHGGGGLIGPETIEFSTPVSYVEFSAAMSPGNPFDRRYPFKMTVYDSQGVELIKNEMTQTFDLTPMWARASGISKIVMDTSCTNYYYDNLAFVPETTNYDVYFGRFNPPTQILYSNLPVPTCKIGPSLLRESTTYYWRVVAKNPAGETAGPVWSFRTITPPGELQVQDSIPAKSNLQMNYGNTPMGTVLDERITVTNTDPVNHLDVTGVSLKGSLVEDFEDGLAQGWEPDNPDNWAVISGEYRASSIATASTSLESHYQQHQWDNVSFHARIHKAGNQYRVARIVARASPDFGYSPMTGSGISTSVDDRGRFTVIRYLNGAIRDFFLDAPSEYLNANGEANDIILSVNGPEIRVYHNGHLAWIGTDSVLLGPGGLALISSNNVDASVSYFDNLVVGEPLSGGILPGDPPSLDCSAAKFKLKNIPLLPAHLGPGKSLAFDVTYGPNSILDDKNAIIIESNDTSEPETEVSLSGRGINNDLTLTPGDTLTTTVFHGEPIPSKSKTYTLKNNSSQSIGWTASVTQPWCLLSNASGTLPAGASFDLTVRIYAGNNSFAVGTHDDRLTITNTKSGSMQSRLISIIVDKQDIETKSRNWQDYGD